MNGIGPPTPLPLDITDILKQDADKLMEPQAVTKYRKISGEICWLSQFRPDLAHPAHILSLFTAVPTKQSMKIAYRVARYVHNTKHYGIIIPKPACGDVLASFVDASHKNKTGQTGFVIGILRSTNLAHTSDESLEHHQFFPLHWKSVKQIGTVYSSMGAELNALHRSTAAMLHTHRTLQELGMEMPMAQFTDSKNTNDQLESSSHPFDLDLVPSLQHLRQRIVDNKIQQYSIPREYQIGDALTSSRPNKHLLPLSMPSTKTSNW